MRTLLAALLLAGCAKSVIPEYELRRDAALAGPAEVPARWQPDAVVVLSQALADDIVAEILTRSGTFKRKVDVGARAHISPDLKLTTLQLSDSDACETCLRVATTLDGSCTWRIGASSGNRPLGGTLDFDIELSAVQDDAGWAVQARPRGVNKAKLKLAGRTFKTVTQVAEAALTDWAMNNVFSGLDPIVIARFEDEGLPLRAVRAVPDTDSVRLELLSTAPVVELADPPSLADGETWALSLSQTALLHAARRASFAKGVISHDVVVEPTAMSLGDGTFTMDLRLWRIKGKGWWRDVEVKGTWVKTATGFDLSAVEADEVAQSKGAAVVDPLAALAEGVIVHAVEDAITRSLPGGQDAEIGGVPVATTVQRLQGERKTVEVGGVARIGSNKAPPPKRAGN